LHGQFEPLHEQRRKRISDQLFGLQSTEAAYAENEKQLDTPDLILKTGSEDMAVAEKKLGPVSQLKKSAALPMDENGRPKAIESCRESKSRQISQNVVNIEIGSRHHSNVENEKPRSRSEVAGTAARQLKLQKLEILKNRYK